MTEAQAHPHTPHSSPSAALNAVQVLWAPDTVRDPYPRYEAVRAAGVGGVLPVPEWNTVFLTGHAAASAVLRSPAAGSGAFMPGEAHSDGQKLLKHMMLGHDGAAHARLRGLVQLAFTPRVVEEQRELVRSLLRELLPPATAGSSTPDTVDLVAGLAHPLPARVIMRMLGLEGEDEARFVRWSGSVAELLGGSDQSAALMARIDADAREMRRYFRDVADNLRVNPRPGLLSALAAAEASGERLSSDELLSNAVLLLTAGHETTSNLIPGGLLELSRQPGAWAALVASPRHANVADELLRVVSPVQVDGRTLNADVTLPDGQVLRAGQHASLLLAAANRDPDVFPHPHRIDWDRPNSARHLAFAAGPHYCLGASLARLEITEVFAYLAEHFPHLRVQSSDPPFKPNLVLRGVQELHVQL